MIRFNLALSRRLLLAPMLSAGVIFTAGSAAALTVAPGYSLSLFAGPLAGSSAPDSIAVVGNSVFVGYGNGGAPDGSGGAMSTIAEYSAGGALLGTITVTGHNDGLRYNAATGKLWAIQNEDGNPNLVLINPTTRATSSPYGFSATPHGGGYDDVAFGPGGATYVSASNPAANPNSGPAIVSVGLGATQVQVTGAALAGEATAHVINTGATTTLNLQDPDSMSFAPNGQLVLDSQSDQQLVFISNVGTAGQSVSVLNLPNTVDDTVFGAGHRGQLLVTDRGSGNVYALTGAFGAGQAISAADGANWIASVNLTNGAMTPLVSDLNSPHGLAFTSMVPEPALWATMIAGFGLVGLRLRRRTRAGACA